MTPSTDATRRISAYLARNPVHSDQISQSAPLLRKVPFRSDSWIKWFSNDDYVIGRKGCSPLDEFLASAVHTLLGNLSTQGEAGTISRLGLVSLAEAAASERDVDSLVQLWVATMMWGSGTSNNRGPWRTRQGLGDLRLAETLSATSGAVLAGDLGRAYLSFSLRGCGRSFFTKWLWAMSLAQEAPPVRPLILDVRVLSTLRRLGALVDDGPVKGVDGYMRYVNFVHEIAANLGTPIDAEKVEWLLFDRTARGGSHLNDEPCLFSWLEETREAD